jgi:hypothetical protein
MNDNHHDSGTAFGNSFELQALSSSQTETVYNDLLPDNDGVNDFLKSLDIPAQETCKILEFFNLFLVTVQSAKVNLPQYRTSRDGH